MILRNAVLSLVLALAPAACVHQAMDPLAGVWRGTWTKAGDTIDVTLTIDRSETGYSATFDSNDLQLAMIPFASAEAQGANVRLTLEGDESTTTFDGTLADGNLSGAMREGEVTGAFELTRDLAPPAPLRTRDIHFTNGEVRLAGTLILPARGGRHPAIVFLHGSGAEGRWGSRYLAQQFARRGFAALIFDKRGVGNSTGDWRTASFDELAQDAAASVRALRSLAEIDPRRIGAYGHSQGSTVAVLLAPLADLNFVIAAAATGASPAETEVYSVANSIGLRELPAQERAEAMRFVREIVAVAYEGRSSEALNAMAEAYRGRPWFFDLPPPEHHYWSMSRLFARYEPAAAWSRVRAPVLLLWGARDERVDPQLGAQNIREALAASGNTRVTTRIYERSDHNFRIVDPPAGEGWARRTPGYVETIIDWANEQAGVGDSL
jgi:uncharacterized protein